jgi:DNA-binding MarR family transcriptional regulator
MNRRHCIGGCQRQCPSLKPGDIGLGRFGVFEAAPERGVGARAEMFRDVVMLFYATIGRLQRLRRLIASSVDLNSAEYSIVAALYRLGPKSGVRIREIADYLHMTPENVTTAVSKLVATKWVVKTIDPDDARAVTLRLHLSARKKIDLLTEDLGEINDIWFQDMSAADIQLLMVYLGRVLDGFDAAYQRASEKFPGSADRMDRSD